MGIATVAARRRAGWLIVAAALSVAALIAGPALVSAHEHREVGPYEFTVGFMVEPAYEGLPNGVDLRVLEDGEPVEGVEATLQVEVTHAESGVSRTMDLRALWGEPGHYTADFIPTAPGRYVFHFAGTIDDVEIDEEFEGGEGRFSDVEPVADIQFPETIATGRELQGAASGAREIAIEADDAAQGARTLAIVGIGVGALGVVVGAAGVILATRGRAS